MSPANKSLLSVFLGCIILTFLLVSNLSDNQRYSSDAPTSASIASQQVSSQLAQQIDRLSSGLANLSNSAVWQKSTESDWALQLSTQSSIYEAAGLSQLGIHSVNSNKLYFASHGKSPSLYGLDAVISRLYQTDKAIQVIHLFEEMPAILFLQPIKSVENEVVGSLIGVKHLDEALLKTFHNSTHFPAALLKSDRKYLMSIDTGAMLNDYNLFDMDWPEGIQSSVWKITLLVKKEDFASSALVFGIIGLLVTGIVLFIVWQQTTKIQSSLRQLKQALNLELPIVEQNKRLTNIQNTCSDLDLMDTAKEIRDRFEQLSQKKKAMAIEVRKLQDSKNALEKIKSDIESQRDSAVAAPRLKSEFLSRMGDEVTTPMKSVVSMLKLLSEYSFEEEPKQLLNIAKRSTRTLVNNLNNIMDFSKLDADMLKLKNNHFSVRELVSELSSELSHFANEKDLSLQSSTAPEMPETVYADEYRIKQILRNLLGNALRFTKQGEVTLYADLSAKGGHKLLRFTVADTGIGIAPAAQKGLFDSLEQTTKLSNSSFAGRLRLIVSRKLSVLMGGEIGIRSEVGQGSQFWFTVAIKEEA
jgi:signal transduction histidine kinase